MSKVAISGNASGTGVFTISSPATNTDRTLTIPDVDGSIVTADASGNVGIGTSSPSVSVSGVGLHLSDTSANTGIRLQDTSFANKDFTIRLDATDNALAIYHENSASECMRITSVGTLLVGKTSADYGVTAGFELNASVDKLHVARSSGSTAAFNRLSTDGEIVGFWKDGTGVGSIGFTATGSYIQGETATPHSGLRFGASQLIPFRNGSDTDDTINLGANSVRFNDIYATNGTIQTSDRNEKQDIEVLSEAEARVAVACKGLLRKFRWKDAVAEKGDEARIHFGIIAQDLQAAFAAEGLDAGRYAMFISSTWWEAERVVPAVEEVLDDEGNVTTEAVAEHTVTETYATAEEAPEGATERTRLGVRYPELLAFIIGAL